MTNFNFGIGEEPQAIEDLTLIDILSFCRPSTIKLPDTPGRYAIVVEASGTYSNNDEEVLVATAEAEATLVISVANAPDIKCLKGLKFYLAEIEPEPPFTISVEDESGDQIDVEVEAIKDQSLLIEKTALLKSLWDNYKINLASLSRAYESYYAGARKWNYSRQREVLLQRAFGDTFDKLDWVTNLTSVTLNDTGAAQDYFELAQVLPLIAILDLINAGDIKAKLPSPACAIQINQTDEKAEVCYFDQGDLDEIGRVPFHPERKDKTITTNLAQYFRLRRDSEKLRSEFRGISTSFRSIEDGEERERLRLIARKEMATNLAKREDLDQRIFSIYVDLTEWASKSKEPALKKLHNVKHLSIQVDQHKTALADKADRFVGLPNNMEGLPAHFAAIPTGLTDGLELTKNPFGQAILLVKRQSYETSGKTPKEQPPATIPLFGLDVTDKEALIKQAEMLLGSEGPRWLIPQGAVAVSKLYRDAGGYDQEESSRRIYLNDWIDTMRPDNVERFKQKGRGYAFGNNRKPRDLFMALIGVLDRLTYEHEGTKEKGWAQLNGFYKILSHGDDNGALWVDIMLNPSLHKFVIGEGGLPYMLTNTKAMFSYDRSSLDYAPAAQWAIEQLARNNLYNRDTAVLSTPDGGGITRLTLAQRFGLLKGTNENASHVLKRFNTVMDNLAKAGVIVDWKVDGREKTGGDAFGVKLHVEMHDDYKKAYNLTKKESALKIAEKELQRPFSIPSNVTKVKADQIKETRVKRGRGRPKKDSNK